MKEVLPHLAGQQARLLDYKYQHNCKQAQIW
jgi:hypothetical protein